MIEFTKGDILKCEAEALVNSVNCVGVMGRGIALQFKEAFPDNFKAYKKACESGEVQPGRMFVFGTGRLTPPRYIINFPTKRHWRGKSRMEDIEAGLAALKQEVQARNIRSIAIPPLGSGLGGLDWREVRARIEQALADLSDVRIIVFEPDRSLEDARPVRTRKVPKMTPGRAALVALVQRYLQGLLDPFVTLLEVHKLLYFLQEAGEPLRLQYVKGPYGPYAENLRHVLNAIEGHLIAGYGERGDSPYQPLSLVPQALEDAEAFLQQHTTTRQRLKTVAELVEGFESPAGLELLASVHWVVQREGAADPLTIERHLHEWGERKRQFTPRQIKLAYEHLERKGWLAARKVSNQ